MAQPNVRIGGQGFTVVSFRGQRLAYCQQVNDQAPQPVAQAEAIQPMDEPHPLEIVTAQAVRAGTLSLQFYELWNINVWNALPGFEGTNTLLDVFRRQLQLGNITCRKIIRNPTGQLRARLYHGCVITDIDESETVQIQSMSMPKTIRIMYTHTTAV